MLIVTALLSVAAQAATPNTPAEKTKAKTPAAASPDNKQKPSVTRRPASFTRQTPLSEAIGILRDSTTPPLKIIALWRPLNSAGVYADTPIGIDGVAGLRAGQVLDLLMLSLSAGASARIDYVVDKGVITISTTDALPAPKLVARIYDVSDLVAPPARYSLQSMGFGTGYGGQMPPLGGYPGNLGTSLSTSATGLYNRSTGPIVRTYYSR
ncbi:MAG: hypothetical protein NTZ17_01840 [Phycisphaerae bacterium]|nr:hypothetical protein [Phycisphaerae bacterium]